MEKVIVGRFRKRPKIDLWSYCGDVFHQMSSAGIDFRKVSNPASEYDTVVIIDDHEDRNAMPWLFRLAELMGTDMIVSSSTGKFGLDYL